MSHCPRRDQTVLLTNVRPSRHRRFWMTAILLWWALAIAPVSAIEPAARFLEALREQGQFELALTYLERIDGSSIISPEFQQAIPYEQGVVYTQLALQRRQLESRGEDLARARSAFERFRNDQPQHELRLAASEQLASCLWQQAKLQTQLAKRPNVSQSQQESHLNEARRLLGETRAVCEANRAELEAALKGFPQVVSAETQATLFKQRQDVRLKYVQTKHLAALCQYEEAQTYPLESDTAKQLLAAAETAFAAVAEKYRTFLPGITAAYYQGRCRQDLGDWKGALGLYEDLLRLDANVPVLRPIRTTALRGAMECWLSDDPPQRVAAIENAEAWLKQQRPTERMQGDWPAVKFRLAQAYKAEADADGGGQDKARALDGARRWATEVARASNEFQTAAQELLVDLGRPVSPPDEVEKVESFDQGIKASEKALSQWQLAANSIRLLESRLGQVSDAQSRAELEQRLEEAKSQQSEAAKRALGLLMQATRLADPETPLEAVNRARYLLCVLKYNDGDFYAASVLGEFLARRYPNTDEGRRSAAYALSALAQLYGDGTSPYAATLIGRITQFADYVANYWQGQPEAIDALGKLVSLSVVANQIDQAKQYLDRLPEDSPRRGVAELEVGQALWRQAAEAEPSTDEGAPALRAEALKLLSDGLARSEGVPVTPQRVAASLTVIDHLLKTGQPAEALRMLNDEGQGPRTLAVRGDPSTKYGGLDQRALILTILATVASLPESADPDGSIADANACLETLKGLVGQDEAGMQQMALIYVALARDLEAQIEQAPPEKRRVLTQAFEKFLDRAASEATGEAERRWMAESYLSLGRALVDGDGRLTDEGRAYVQKGADIFRQLIAATENAAGQDPASLAKSLQLQMQLATAYREVGAFPQAMEIFVELLKKRESYLALQFEAARTLQAWGDQGKADAYLKAMRGDEPKPGSSQNLIWGYYRIANAVASRPDLIENFHEARYRLAECRYRYALRLPKAERDQTLAQAANDILAITRLYPDMGGPQRKAAYDSLLKEIQQSQGKPPTGLKP